MCNLSVAATKTERGAADGPGGDQDEQQERKGNACKQEDTLLGAEPPRVVLLDHLHLVRVLLKLLRKQLHFIGRL